MERLRVRSDPSVAEPEEDHVAAAGCSTRRVVKGSKRSAGRVDLIELHSLEGPQL